MERANLPRQMHAAVLVGPDQLELQEVETPRPGHAEVLIRVEACALCNSDVSLIHKPWAGRPPYGRFVAGQEHAGTVVALGDRVDELGAGKLILVATRDRPLALGRRLRADVKCRQGGRETERLIVTPAA